LRKIVILIILFVFCSGCSLLKNRTIRDNLQNSEGIINCQYFKIRSQNISLNSFFIEKADVFFKSQDNSQHLLASIKFKVPDKYLISLRSKTGIEAGRIYITRDSIFINDRINKKFYYGSSLFLTKKYGISGSWMPIVMGDLISPALRDTSDSKCIKGTRIIETSVKGYKLKYLADCTLFKVISTEIEGTVEKESVNLFFDKFKAINFRLYPKRIKIEDNKRNFFVTLSIVRILTDWKGEIDFIPGNRYERIPLQ
jgi:hypothetical protein